jgi:hypothetical protein
MRPERLRQDLGRGLCQRVFRGRDVLSSDRDAFETCAKEVVKSSTLSRAPRLLGFSCESPAAAYAHGPIEADRASNNTETTLYTFEYSNQTKLPRQGTSRLTMAQPLAGPHASSSAIPASNARTASAKHLSGPYVDRFSAQLFPYRRRDPEHHLDEPRRVRARAGPKSASVMSFHRQPAFVGSTRRAASSTAA